MSLSLFLSLSSQQSRHTSSYFHLSSICFLKIFSYRRHSVKVLDGIQINCIERMQKLFKIWLFFMLTFILPLASCTHPHTGTHTEATQVSHVLVPQYERKIPSGTGSPVWLHPSPHPGMITRMGSGALDFLQHVHSLMPAHSPMYKPVPTFRGKSLDPTGTAELQSAVSTYGKREGEVKPLE